jgi:hypothetical protein
MYANVYLQSALPEKRLVVPQEAVIDSGVRKRVFVSRGKGKFEPREVTLGVEGNDYMFEVIDGLAEGEEIVALRPVHVRFGKSPEGGHRQDARGAQQGGANDADDLDMDGLTMEGDDLDMSDLTMDSDGSASEAPALKRKPSHDR